ncbi:hypothetical protein ACFX13_035496 [Malus domestica]
MACPSNICLDLSLRTNTGELHQDNIWRPSFLSSNDPLTVRDSVMKNNITATVVARNLFTPKDNRILSERSNELAVQDSLVLSVQCAGSVSNIGQHLLARTHQVESLIAEVSNLKQNIKGLKHENRVVHMLTNNYSTSMKRKLDQLLEFESRTQSDNQRFDALFQRHLLPSSSGVLPSIETPNNQPLVPPPFGVLPSTEVSHDVLCQIH